MLATNLVRNAYTTAQQLKQRGVALTPTDNSILSELVASSEPLFWQKPADEVVQQKTIDIARPGAHNCDSMLNPDDFASNVAWATINSDEISVHSLRILAVADQIAPLVQSHISTAKNIVAPEMFRFEEDANRFLDQVRSIDPAQAYFVKQVKFPAILVDETFLRSTGLDEIQNPTEVNESDVGYPIRIDVKSEEEVDTIISQIMAFGSDRLASGIQDWLKIAHFDLLKRVFIVNFTSLESVNSTRDKTGNECPGNGNIWSDYYFSQYNLRRGFVYDAVNIGLATFLITNWLKNNVQKTVQSVSLERYKKYFSDINLIAGVTVRYAVRKVDLSLKQGVLVASIQPKDKTVYVYAETYKTWLEQGGEPEVLLGLLVSGESLFDSKLILEKAEKFKSLWSANLKYVTDTQLLDLKQNFYSWVRSYMMNTLNDLTSFELEAAKNIPGLRELIISKVDQELSHLGHTLHTNIPHTALHVIAKGRFFYTAAYAILGEMKKVEEVNAESDAREAATVAAIKYLVEYFLTQTKNALKVS